VEKRFIMAAFSKDRPGVVADITIENLTSQRRLSPESGAAIYFMNIKVQVPEDISSSYLEEGLSQVGEELHLGITVH